MSYVPRLKTKYQSQVVPALMEQFNYSSIMQVPRLEKICINQGIGDATGDKKMIDTAAAELSMIVGQKAVPTKAKQSISNFKLRAGINLGCVVTLRRDRMWEFLDRFIAVAVPRIRDFRGFPEKSFDGRGNYSFGIKEHTIFPEVDYDKVDKIRGFNVTIGTSAVNDAEALELLRELGFPFRKQGA